MKTVEELAREVQEVGHDCPIAELADRLPHLLERFRDLVLEEAALAVYTATDNMHDERDIVLKEIIADAIRTMKGKK